MQTKNDLDNMVKIKNIGENLKNIFKEIYTKLNLNMSFDNFLLKKFEKIHDLMNELSNKLEHLVLFEKEFLNFLSIKNMINYVINDVNRFILYSSFAKSLTDLFCNLINSKIKLIKSCDKSYDKIYEEFDEKLFQYEEFFYLNIYESNHEYDDLVDEVANILWG